MGNDKFKWILIAKHDIMSVSEREQAKPIHRERRMAITNRCEAT